MKLKHLKITAITLLTLLVIAGLVVGSYVLIVMIQYDRIDDNVRLDAENNSSALMHVGEEYTIATYNIGFGAYDKEFDFFMDSGRFKDEYGGSEVYGTHGKAMSRERVIENTNGSIELLKATHPEIGSELDFMLFQEVDTNSDRSYHVDQYAMMKDAYSCYNMGSTFALNFHSSNLIYPINDPHGKSTAGLVTFSKYRIDDSIRRQYPISSDFSKFFDLDRCFVINEIAIEGGKKFVLINSHMSAYDEGGVYRTAQLKMLNDIIKAERDAGNYVIVGGDFNHDIAASKDIYPSWMVTPDESANGWLYQLFDGANVRKADDPEYSDLAEGYSFATTLGDSDDDSVLVPTCRGAEMPYERADDGTLKNYQAVLDGFIVSDNIEVVRVQNINADFAYSDHNPVKLTFRLK